MVLTAVMGMMVCGAVVWKAEMKKHEADGMKSELRKVGSHRLNAALLRSGDSHSIAVLASLATLQEQIRGGRWSEQCLTDILNALGDKSVNRIVRVRAMATLALPFSEGKFTYMEKERAKSAIRVCLYDENWIIRLKACEMAYRFQDVEAVEELRALRSDIRPEVRPAAGKALAGIKGA